MGVLKKQGGKESEGKKWLIAGIPVRAPLKSISTKSKEGCEDYDECCTTPPTGELKIPEIFTCPAAPRKRRPSLKRHFDGVEFFNPPDLESVFILHAERTK
ncbi:Hypothetical predicted protein [Olea europaea subsp. europaea]|uniref:Cyclin-dependent protein kinase inhibitor SMR6 n=1 Tax=Olea europaea subsp. europaea TaxID=158383 RepID=A0A8S0RKC7_OLEEU|nr:Hypothetical predicted protein [Olea europaea subsp. europaea]